MSYGVNQRVQEIGIRMALGAAPRDVRWQVIGSTLRLATGGLLVGLGGSLVLARLLASQLFGVTPADPITFVAVASILTLVAILAGALPTHRASRTDPMSALRSG